MSASSNALSPSEGYQCSRHRCSRRLQTRGPRIDVAICTASGPMGLDCLVCSLWLAHQVLAGEKGFEPLHAGIKIQCLNQLGDSPTRVDDQSRQPICRAGMPNIPTLSRLPSPGEDERRDYRTDEPANPRGLKANSFPANLLPLSQTPRFRSQSFSPAVPVRRAIRWRR